jgi:hypothetical protein
MTTTAATEATRTPSARYTDEEGLPGGDVIATWPSFSPCESNVSYFTTWPTSPE